MTIFKLRHVDSFFDKDQKTLRHYFRKGHGKRVLLPGLPGSKEFREAYEAAFSASTGNPSVGQPDAEGTFARLAQDYFRSSKFLKTKKPTQGVTRGIIERFIAEHGHRSVKGMTRADVMKIMGEKAKTPAAANNLLKKLRVLIGFAIVTGVRKDDPTLKMDKYSQGSHHSWTDEELDQYEAKYPLGTFERTAYALHLYTGQRRGDVCTMGWNDITNNTIRVVQEKGQVEGDEGADCLYIPIDPRLQKALDAWGKRHVSILVGKRGKPYTVESYGNIMADYIAGAGLPERCVLHGLRKAAARRLAECGCSSKEIAAITGHKSLKEVERYVNAADQKRLAQSAVQRLQNAGT